MVLKASRRRLKKQTDYYMSTKNYEGSLSILCPARVKRNNSTVQIKSTTKHLPVLKFSCKLPCNVTWRILFLLHGTSAVGFYTYDYTGRRPQVCLRNSLRNFIVVHHRSLRRKEVFASFIYSYIMPRWDLSSKRRRNNRYTKPQERKENYL